MRVLCCAVPVPSPAALAALRKYAPHAEVVSIDPADWRGYWRAVAERWGDGDLLNVEQDNILHADVIPQLEACPEPWCVFPYRHPCAGPDGWVDTGLGCTRFRQEFQLEVPTGVIAAVGGNCNLCDGQDAKHECWIHVEGRISDAGKAAGFRPHRHSPSAGHRDVAPGEIYATQLLERQP